MNNSENSFSQLMNVVSDLIDNVNTLDNYHYDTILGASQLALKEGFFLEAVRYAASAADIGQHSKVIKEQRGGRSNFRAVCKEIFERGGLKDDKVAEAVLSEMTFIAMNYGGESGNLSIHQDWKRYAKTLLADGKTSLVKELAIAATAPMNRNYALGVVAEHALDKIRQMKLAVA